MTALPAAVDSRDARTCRRRILFGDHDEEHLRISPNTALRSSAHSVLFRLSKVKGNVVMIIFPSGWSRLRGVKRLINFFVN